MLQDAETVQSMEVFVRHITDKRQCVPPWAKTVCLSKVRHNGGKAAVSVSISRNGALLEKAVQEEPVEEHHYRENAVCRHGRSQVQFDQHPR